ncbi:MAG: heavy-metal-associated domain-containing protein [Lewinellaceae bacterium]|nr:heavy-metal-associated domain-containing protein [Lewinellaceae bacterium]
MKKVLKFKTNIKCMGCVSNVTDALNRTAGSGNWEVDILSPHKELTVTSDNLDAEGVVAALAEAGYTATAIDGQSN